jgi:hypothetical protein
MTTAPTRGSATVSERSVRERSRPVKRTCVPGLQSAIVGLGPTRRVAASGRHRRFQPRLRTPYGTIT